ncbi:hypothetical protein [Paenarthrobacter sp. NPDC058040]|uniref:hypothetical protein n=1 Tax=unclassified Paenarthrobacter TaxID=2634190 RepID=UPI0036DE797F
MFRLRQAPTGDLREDKFSISMDDTRSWDLIVPGWRDVVVGRSGETAYAWSARSVIVLPANPDLSPAVIPFNDEDIVAAFPAGDLWLLVAETSIRLVGADIETARIDLREVVDFASFDGSIVTITDVDRDVYRFEVSQTQLLETAANLSR